MNSFKFSSIFVNKLLRRCHFRSCINLNWNVSVNYIQGTSKTQFYCTTSNKENEQFNQHKALVKNELKAYIRQNTEKLRDTEQKLKQKGTVILQDIKETTDKVKVKVEEVIERENIYTIPNLLCVSRILLSPYLGVLIVQANFDFALAVLGIAAVTDLVKSHKTAQFLRNTTFAA